MGKFKIGSCVRTKSPIVSLKDTEFIVLGYTSTTGEVLLGNVMGGHRATSISRYYDENGNGISDPRNNTGHYFDNENNLTLIDENTTKRYSSVKEDRPLDSEGRYKVEETPKIKLLTNKNIIKIDQNF